MTHDTPPVVVRNRLDGRPEIVVLEPGCPPLVLVCAPGCPVANPPSTQTTTWNNSSDFSYDFGSFLQDFGTASVDISHNHGIAANTQLATGT